MLIATATRSRENTFLHDQSSTSDTSTDPTARSQAVLDLNLKLQSTAIKNQARLVDLDLLRIDLSQANNHIQLLEAYLPAAYTPSDSAAISTYLTLSRITRKTELLNQVLSQMHDLPRVLEESEDESLVGICELRGQLVLFAGVTRQLTAIIRRSGPVEFLEFGKTLQDLAALESKLDSWIEQSKREEMQEREWAVGLRQ